MRDGLDLKLRLAHARRNHRTAKRPRAGLQHHAGRGEVVGEGVVDQIAFTHAGGEERAGETPVVLAGAFGLVDGARGGEDAARLGHGNRRQTAEGRIRFLSFQ